MSFSGQGEKRDQPDPREKEQAYGPRDEQPGNEQCNIQGWNATVGFSLPMSAKFD